MRSCLKCYRFIKPGDQLPEERNQEPKKKAAKPLTAAQKRKIAELEKRIAEMNAEKLRGLGIHPGGKVEIKAPGKVPQGVEVR